MSTCKVRLIYVPFFKREWAGFRRGGVTALTGQGTAPQSCLQGHICGSHVEGGRYGSAEPGEHVPVVSYPAVLGTGFAVYASLLWLGWPVTLASYVAVVTGAALVTLHETKLPYRREWRPNAGVVTADAVFMGTVQGVLPLLLSFTVVIWLAGLLDTTGCRSTGCGRSASRWRRRSASCCWRRTSRDTGCIGYSTACR